MFSFFNNLLYPSRKFLTSVLKILKYDPSTYDIDELVEQMDENEQCELLNSSIDINYINEKLKNSKYFLSNFGINKTTFIFKKTYLTDKTTLSFEGINIDVMNKIMKENEKNENKEGNSKPQKEKSEGGLLDNLINTVIHNVEVIFNNIKIRLFDKDNKNVEYSFFIKKIEYKENENVDPIKQEEKIKYLFLHNKTLFIEGILFKEKYEKKDDIFFNDNDSKLALQNNILFYIKNKIQIDMFYNKENYNLTIGDNNNSEFYIESIMNIQQFKSFFNNFISQKEKENIDIKNNDAINLINNDVIDSDKKELLKSDENNVDTLKKEKKPIDLMGYKIEKIQFELKIWLFYFILINNNDKEKLWISHQENLINKKEININNDIINHFNSYKEKYYIFCMNDLLFSTNNKELSLNDLLLQKNELKNDINNHNELDYEYKNIININNVKFNLKSKEILYDNIILEISPNLFYLIKKFNLFKEDKDIKYKEKNNEKLIEDNKITVKENNTVLNIDNKNGVNEDEINTDNKIGINEEKKILLHGKNLNIKIFIDKNIEESIQKEISFDGLFVKKEDKKDFIDFILTNLIVNKEEKIVVSYDKFNLTYNDKENRTYQFFKILEDKNILQQEKNIIINYKNELSVDLQFIILIFINPEILKNVLNFSKLISQIFRNKRNKKKKDYNDDFTNYNEDECSEKNKKNVYLQLKQIKIFIINEIENYLNIEKLSSNLPKINVNEKINNNYICVNINEIGGKLEYDINKNTKKLNVYLKSLIIEDNIMNSMYKVLLSNYNFKNKEDNFINCEFEIQNNNNNTNQYEIKPYIKICPIAIYLDQITLYFLYQTYYLFVGGKENQKENKNEKINEKNVEKNKNNRFIIYNSNIENFFIQINYVNNKEVKDKDFFDIKFIKYLNSTSLKNLNIYFNEYKNGKDYFSINEAIKDIYEFYFNEIKDQMESGYLMPALPLLNHFFSIIDGAFNIVREPIKKYNKKESIIDGFVLGVNNFVVNSASVFTHLGEPLFNYLNSLGCSAKKEDDDNNSNYNFCRNLRHHINEKNKEIEEFYFK